MKDITGHNIDLDIDRLSPDNFIITSEKQFYHKQIENDDVCMYCHDVLKNNICRLDCGHYIHDECFDLILKYKKLDTSMNIFTKCPYCSSKITISNKLIIKNSNDTAKLTPNMCQLQLDAMLKIFIMSYENYVFPKIKIQMYQDSTKITENFIRLEKGDRSRVEELESGKFKQITNMFKLSKHQNTYNKIFTNINSWYNIWIGNDIMPFINGSAPYMYKHHYTNYCKPHLSCSMIIIILSKMNKH